MEAGRAASLARSASRPATRDKSGVRDPTVRLLVLVSDILFSMIVMKANDYKTMLFTS